uniref:WhiB family transcriptional regulator n=1 Tax=Kitasatospora indigofera TaxID=67307 RepID=UPI002F90C5DA
MLRDLVLAHPPGRIPCLAQDGELWFSKLAGDQRTAAAWCCSCPVVRPCRDTGRALRAAYGVWGGESPRERRQAGHADRKT